MNIPRSKRGAHKHKYKCGGRSIAHQHHNETRTLMMSLRAKKAEESVVTNIRICGTRNTQTPKRSTQINRGNPQDFETKAVKAKYKI